jgi:hypothetical protein
MFELLFFVLRPLLLLQCCFGVRITHICRIVLFVVYVSYCDVFLSTGRNHHSFRVDFSPNNMLLLSLDRVNGLLLPIKIEPGVGSLGGHEHGEGYQVLPFPAVLNINVRGIESPLKHHKAVWSTKCCVRNVKCDY